MPLLSLLLACGPAQQSFDISSTLLLTDHQGQLVDGQQLEVCQTLEVDVPAEEETPESPSLSSQCQTLEVVEGLAFLPNWEGSYPGDDPSAVELRVELSYEGERLSAVLVDTDREVWCDNVIDHNAGPECSNLSMQLCTESFEHYMLWRATLPAS